MEITLLVEAMDTSFSMMEEASSKAVELLDSAVKLTSETRSVEERKVHALIAGQREKRTKTAKFAMTFCLLFAFWLLLSGKFDLFHITLGVICSIFVSWFSYDLLFANIRLGDTWTIFRRFVMYIPWLLYEIIISNFHVASLALRPKMPISPRIIRFKSKLESDISYVTLANSITLTPGTVTMDIEGDELVVHALDRKVAEDLDAGEMEDRVAHIFMEADHMYVQDVLDFAPIFGELRK